MASRSRCSLLASEDAQNYQPPPPDVLKDQGIKVKRRRKSSSSRRLAKAALLTKDGSHDSAASDGSQPPSAAGPSQLQPSAVAGPSRMAVPDELTTVPLSSEPPPATSTSPPRSASSRTTFDARPLVLSMARPMYVLAPPSAALPSMDSPAQRLSPMYSNSLGSLPIRRSSVSTSPASVSSALKRPYDWDVAPQNQQHSILSILSPAFPSHPSSNGRTPPPPPAASLGNNAAPPAPTPVQERPSSNSLDFLLTPWSPTNDAIGPASIRPRPLEPLPALSERAGSDALQAGERVRGETGLARAPELEPVVEESPENSNSLHYSPHALPPPPSPLAVSSIQPKAEPMSTPATTAGSLKHVHQSPALAEGNGQADAGMSYATSRGSLTSPYMSNPALPQELLDTLAEPSDEARASLQGAFTAALGWLFPWCDHARLGRASKGGLWAVWSLGVRLSCVAPLSLSCARTGQAADTLDPPASPRNTADKSKTSRAHAYLARAKDLAAASAISSGEPSVEHLEMVILIAWADYGLAETPKATWNWCGVGIKLAEGLALYEADPALVPRLGVVLQSLYQLDKILAIRLRRPPSFPLSSPLSAFIPRPVSHPTTSFEAVTTLCAFFGQVAYCEHSLKAGLMTESDARSRADQVLQDLETWLTDLKGRDGFLTRRDEAESRGRVWVELWLQGVLSVLPSAGPLRLPSCETDRRAPPFPDSAQHPAQLAPPAASPGPALGHERRRRPVRRLPLPPPSLRRSKGLTVALPWRSSRCSSSASAVSTLVQTVASVAPASLLSPHLDVPVSFALSVIEADIEAMQTSPAAGLGQGIVKDQRLEESRALREWLSEAGGVWGI